MTTTTFDLTTSDQLVALLPGTYLLNLLDFSTPDPSDTLHLQLKEGVATLLDPYGQQTELDDDGLVSSYSWFLEAFNSIPSIPFANLSFPGGSANPLAMFALEVTEAVVMAVSTEDNEGAPPYDTTPTDPTATLAIETISQDAFTLDLAQIDYEIFGNVDTESFTISTGGGDRAASSLGNWIMGDRNYLTPFGTEGSGIQLEGIPTGRYEIDWSMLSNDIYGNNDTLYAWNGKELTVIGDRTGETQTSNTRWTNGGTGTVDVLYGELYVFAMDVNDKQKTTEFTIEGVSFVEELAFVPQPIAIDSGAAFGDYREQEQYVQIGTSAQDQAVASIAEALGADLDVLTGMDITEGSFLTYTIAENQAVELTWQFLSRDQTPMDEKVLIFDELGAVIQDVDLSALTNIGSGNAYRSDRITTTLYSPGQTFSIGVFDTADTAGSSYVRVTGLETVDMSLLS